MKIQYCSNLVNVFSRSSLPKPVAPLLILLGDIVNPYDLHAKTKLSYFSQNWNQTIWIPGKYELIHSEASYEEALQCMKDISPKNIKILSNECYDFNNSIILGTTLFSSEFKHIKFYPKGHIMRKSPIREELMGLIVKDHNWLKGILEELKEHNISKKIIVASYTAPFRFSDETCSHNHNHYEHLFKSARYSPNYWFIGNTEKNMSLYDFDDKNNIIHFGSNSAKYLHNFGKVLWEKIEMS